MPRDNHLPNTGAQVRQGFLEYFRENGHLVVPSSPLIPHGDPTLLLTNAGMVQMKPYFLGQEQPPSPRLTSSQKCFRTIDIDIVGNERTLTFFEMLGNFSVGDYFKEGAISFAWELSTKRFNIPADRIWVTIYPDDDEAYALWQRIAGIPAERIVRLEDNWWGPAGETGPCGPDSELYLDRGLEFGCGKADCRPGCDCARFLEFWNLVFMQFYQDENKVRTPLPRKHIDTGMGLERATMLLQGHKSVYETDLFRPIIAKGEELVGVKYGNGGKIDFSLRVLADHSRAATFLIADGVLPSNEGRGYILRRILRRAVRHGRLMGLDRPFLAETAKVVINMMGEAYPELVDRQDFILRVIGIEESRFRQTLATGLGVLSEVIAGLQAKGIKEVPGEDAFRLYDTFGFPKELTAEVASENGMSVDLAGFDRAMERQREQARAAAKFGLGPREATEAYEQLAVGDTPFVGYEHFETDARVVGIVAGGQPVEKALAGQEVEIVLQQTPFYPEGGGQIGDTGWITGEGGKAQVLDTRRPSPALIAHRAVVAEGHIEIGDLVHAEVDGPRRQQIMRHHTATHLLHKALREILGQHAQQAGSLVAPDRLRFDFAHLTAVSKEELAEIEKMVSESIRANYDVNVRVVSFADAMANGAVALFGEKYGETVRMVSIDDYSRELCGGTHVGRTGDIGSFIIIGESSIGAGLRRIEALAGKAADEYAAEQRALLDRLAQRLETRRVEERVGALLSEIQDLRREVSQMQRAQAGRQVETLMAKAYDVDGVKVVAAQVPAPSVDSLREMGDQLRARLGPSVVVLGTVIEDRPNFVAMVSPNVGVHAGNLVKQVASVVGGGGGGRPDVGQAGGKDPSKIGDALDRVRTLVKEALHK